MAKKSTGHPARISGIQKFVHNLEIQRRTNKKTRPKFDPLDLSKPDWSKG